MYLPNHHDSPKTLTGPPDTLFLQQKSFAAAQLAGVQAQDEYIVVMEKIISEIKLRIDSLQQLYQITP